MATIEGHVYYLNTNTPVPGAKVKVVEANKETEVNQVGYFSVDVPEGKYTLEVTSNTTEPFSTAKGGVPAPGKINIYLKPSTTLQGKTGLQGYVLNRDTGQPIKGARISIAGQLETYSDENGYYYLEFPDWMMTDTSIQFNVTYEASGYNSITYTITFYKGLITRMDAYLAPTAPTPPSPQPTEKYAWISGQVFLDDKPVEGAEVRADVYAPGIIGEYWTTKTDSSGKYSLQVVCPDINLLYIVKATKDSISATQNIILSPGVRQTLNFYLKSGAPPTPTPPTLPNKGYITGKVIDYYSKQPVVGASVVAVEQKTLGQVTGTTGNDGTFKLEAPTDTDTLYKVTVSKEKYNDWTGWAKLSANQTFDFGEIPLVLKEYEIGEFSATVYGKVYDPSGKPVAGAEVKCTVFYVGPVVTYNTRTDVNGNYSLKVSWSRALVNPGFKLEASYADLYASKDISLSAGQNVQVDLYLSKGKPSLPEEILSSIISKIPWWGWAAGAVVGGLIIYKLLK